MTITMTHKTMTHKVVIFVELTVLIQSSFFSLTLVSRHLISDLSSFSLISHFCDLFLKSKSKKKLHSKVLNVDHMLFDIKT